MAELPVDLQHLNSALVIGRRFLQDYVPDPRLKSTLTAICENGLDCVKELTRVMGQIESTAEETVDINTNPAETQFLPNNDDRHLLLESDSEIDETEFVLMQKYNMINGVSKRVDSNDHTSFPAFSDRSSVSDAFHTPDVSAKGKHGKGTPVETKSLGSLKNASKSKPESKNAKASRENSSVLLNSDESDSCHIVGVEGNIASNKLLRNRKGRFTKALSNASRTRAELCSKSFPLNNWRAMVRDEKLIEGSERWCVKMSELSNLPSGKTKFTLKEIVDLGIISHDEVRPQISVHGDSDVDKEIDNLTRMPNFSKNKAQRKRSHPQANRRTSANGGLNEYPSVEEEEEEFSEESDSSLTNLFKSLRTPTGSRMSDDDGSHSEDDDSDWKSEDEEKEGDEEEDDDFEALSDGDSDFVPRTRSKAKAKKTAELPQDIQRLLRQPTSEAKPSSRKTQSSSSKNSTDESDVVMRRRTAKNKNVSNSDQESDNEELSDSDFEKPKRKRKSIKRRASTSEDDDSSKGRTRVTRNSAVKSKSNRVVVMEEGSNSGDDKGNKKKKRRRIKRTSELELSTRKAMKDEDERRKRIEKRQELYNAALMSLPKSAEGGHSVILEVDPESGQPTLEMNPLIAKKLKKHQIEAVKFMWETCCESLEQLNNPRAEGSGCIVAHCMGLGKTLSVIAFVHTLIANSHITGVRTCLVLAPLNTVYNWTREFEYWVPTDDEIDVRELCTHKQMRARQAQISGWRRDGGVLVLNYEMYRRLVNDYKPDRGSPKKGKHNVFHEALVNPGADIVVCDEGHILKTSSSAISRLAAYVHTKRRIVLTGTPLQNNLFEYHCMVSFVKPGLLGTKDEFANRFANPIKQGESKDSTASDEKLMKRRICVLHRLLRNCVHRRGYENLTDVLPPKFEYVLLLRLSKLQAELYVKYLTEIVGVSSTTKMSEYEAHNFRRRLFADYHTLRYVGTHPYLLLASKLRKEEKEERAELRDMLTTADRNDASSSSGGEVRVPSPAEPEASSGSEVVILSDSDEEDESGDSVIFIGADGEEMKKPKQERVVAKREPRGVSQRNTRSQGLQVMEKPNKEALETARAVDSEKYDWFLSLVTEDMAKSIEVSSKFLILMHLLRAFEELGDKTLIFSQSLFFLDLLEEILHAEQERRNAEDVERNSDLISTWEPDYDYFRIDGQVGASNRDGLIKRFNDPRNSRARLFLISTRAGGLGINLTGANRVIITDVSWNPSNDLQALFRAYRFGQTKPVYVYRLVAAGTMEERIYDRQVVKQSLSQRVVDEQQILRHFSTKDIVELYQFNMDENVMSESPQESLSNSLMEEQPLPLVGATTSNSQSDQPSTSKEGFSRFAVPKDKVFAEVLRKFPHVVKDYHDHDSLLAHQEDQVLDDDERKIAWNEYEAEKCGIHVNSEDPKRSHELLTLKYQNQYRIGQAEAAFHALNYLKDQFYMRQVVRDYVDKYMPYFEALVKEEKNREVMARQQLEAQAQQLANLSPGAASVSVQQILQNLNVPNIPKPPNFDLQSRQSAMSAIRQYAPFERDAILPSVVTSTAMSAQPSQQASPVLSSLMQNPMQRNQRPPGGRSVLPSSTLVAGSAKHPIMPRPPGQQQQQQGVPNPAQQQQQIQQAQQRRWNMPQQSQGQPQPPPAQQGMR